MTPRTRPHPDYKITHSGELSVAAAAAALWRLFRTKEVAA